MNKSEAIRAAIKSNAYEASPHILAYPGGQVLFDGEPAAIFKEHGAELVQVGVDVPQVYKLADLLRQRGVAVPEGIKDEMALVRAIKEAKGWK